MITSLQNVLGVASVMFIVITHILSVVFIMDRVAKIERHLRVIRSCQEYDARQGAPQHPHPMD